MARKKARKPATAETAGSVRIQGAVKGQLKDLWLMLKDLTGQSGDGALLELVFNKNKSLEEVVEEHKKARDRRSVILESYNATLGVHVE